MTLQELLAELDTFQDQIPLDSLKQQLTNTTITSADSSQFSSEKSKIPPTSIFFGASSGSFGVVGIWF